MARLEMSKSTAKCQKVENETSKQMIERLYPPESNV